MAVNVCYRTLQSSRFAPTLHIAAMLILLCRTCGVSGDAQLVRAGRQLLKRDPRRLLPGSQTGAIIPASAIAPVSLPLWELRPGWRPDARGLMILHDYKHDSCDYASDEHYCRKDR
jgi:hypothetical protein